MGFLGSSVVKNPPANAGDPEEVVATPESEDPLEKEMAPTPVFLPGKSHGQSSLAGYRLGVTKSPVQLRDLITTTLKSQTPFLSLNSG